MPSRCQACRWELSWLSSSANFAASPSFAERKSSQGQIRRLQAAGDINSRPQAKTQTGGIEGLVSVASYSLERAQPEAIGALEDLQAALDKQAILSQHGHEIGHRPQGHEVEQFVEIAAALLAGKKKFAEGLHQLEGDANAGQAFERIRTIAAIGVDDGKRARQFGELLVVIDHDDLHAARRGQL